MPSSPVTGLSVPPHPQGAWITLRNGIFRVPAFPKASVPCQVFRAPRGASPVILVTRPRRLWFDRAPAVTAVVATATGPCQPVVLVVLGTPSGKAREGFKEPNKGRDLPRERLFASERATPELALTVL